MSWLVVAAGGVVVLGAGVAVGARGARAATVGVLVALVFAPFVADPLPGAPVVAFRIVAGILAAYLVRVTARRAGDDAGSPLGLASALAAAAAAFAAGLGATAVGLPAFGPDGAVAAGLACIVVALPPVIRAGDAFRLGTGLLVLANGGLLLRAGLAGTAPALEMLLAGAALVALAAAAAVLAGTAAVASGDLGIPADAGVRRRPPA